MARKTFGRDGQSITTDSGTIESTGKPQSSDVIPGTDEHDRIAAGEPDGTEGKTELDFEPIGEPLTTADSEPATTDPTTAERTKRKYTRRGTSSASSGKPTGGKASQAVLTANLEKLLMMGHSFASAMLKEPSLAIEKDEAEMLSEALKEVATAYDFKAILSPKTQALVDLALVAGTIYGPRLMLIAKQSKKHKPVVVIRPNGAEPVTTNLGPVQ